MRPKNPDSETCIRCVINPIGHSALYCRECNALIDRVIRRGAIEGDMDAGELAEMTGLSRATVLTRVSRLKKRARASQ